MKIIMFYAPSFWFRTYERVLEDVPEQDVISRDNVSVKVNAVVYFRVIDAEKAIIQVENFLIATGQLAQTTLRAVLGKHELDEMLAEQSLGEREHGGGRRQSVLLRAGYRRGGRD